MQTQVSNGRTGRPKFVSQKSQSTMSKAMKASWERRRAAKAAQQNPDPDISFKWVNAMHPPALTEIDALITARQTELDQLRAVRAMLTAKS